MSDEETPKMSSVIGNFEQFSEHSDFEGYLERFESFLVVNKISDEKIKTQWFINFGGPVLFKNIKSVCAPQKPGEVAFKDLLPKLEELLKPKNIEVLERATFNSRSQGLGENISAYALALRELAQSCNFGPGLDSYLRDRFIVGLKNNNMKHSILKSNPKSFYEALSLAQTAEVASSSSQNYVSKVNNNTMRNTHKQKNNYRQNRNSNNFRQNDNGNKFRQNNNGVYKHYNNDKNQKCKRCGRFNHRFACPAIN